MPERVDFWGIPHTWGSPEAYTYTIMAVATLILLFRFYQRASLWWRVGRPDMRWDQPLVRVGRLISYAIVQTKVLSQRYPGLMHIALAWSFFIFFLGTALATIHSHFFEFLHGNTYLIYKLMLDTFTVLFLIGATMAAYRRFVQRPPRLTRQPGFAWSLGLITVIVAGGLLVESLRLAILQPAWGFWAPAGWVLARMWIATGASETTLHSWHLAMWIFHLFTVVVLFVTLPVGTLLHLLTGPLNAFFSKLDRPMGQLAPIPETAQGEPIYAGTLRDLTWKQLLDGDACTECGRCQDVCPAFITGAALSPKELMVTLRISLRQDGPNLINGNGRAPLFVGAAVDSARLWSCTTCGACVGECPMLIEHVDAIVEMRRFLVNEGQIDVELQGALAKLGRYGNSYGQSARARAKWTRPIMPKIKDARKEPVDYLWFVGDYASYNAGLTDITQMTADLFRKVGLDYGILYDAESNAGNDVRRVGEEGLFEMLVDKNTAALSKCQYQAIVTTDPHTYNTLKHEYPPDINGRRPVLHYTELLDQLLASGALRLTKQLNYTVTYHDPCYLGRYNGVYDAPRRVIKATGCELVEMPRNRDRALCCGAGGGRIWMEEGLVKERPSEMRIREAAGLNGVQVLVVACPKDVTMYRDAIKTTGHEDQLVVKDLVELVHEAL